MKREPVPSVFRNSSENRLIKADVLLLITALFWGFSFVTQRVSVQQVPAFFLNGLRFTLGSMAILPMLAVDSAKRKKRHKKALLGKAALLYGIITGTVLFTASILQQIGLIYTTAGKAGFITDLYVVFVPVAGIFLKQRVKPLAWASVALAVAGLYLVSVTEQFTISVGDIFELAGACLWTLHIYLLDRFTKKVDAVWLSLFQFIVCALWSFSCSLLWETVNVQNVAAVAVPILYSGVLAVGIAYTFQALGQRDAKPTHAAILLSMESVFAVLGGVLVLHESMTYRSIAGCVLMFCGMFLAQFSSLHGEKQKKC